MASDKKQDTAAHEDQAAAQAAQVAEANGDPRTIDFHGFTYEVAPEQPSPRALEYVARWSVDDERMAMVLAIKEMIGARQWSEWCERHTTEQLSPFWFELNRVAGGGN